jgi:hypothetical protein
MRRAAFIATATLVLAAVLPAADAATRNAAHLFLFPGKGGAATVWISANNAGQAVGQKLKGSVDDFVYFDGTRAHDLTPVLGHGAFSSIDQLGEAAGTTSQGFPVYYDTRTGRKAILGTQGRATGIALGPLVAVTLPNGSAELWNPLTGATLSLGDPNTTGVNAWGTVVGNSNRDLWYSVPDGHGGAVQHTLPTWGNFDHVNELNVATGYRDVKGGIKPISYDIQSHKLTNYKLPKGFSYGVVTGENDSGTIAYGNAFRNKHDLKTSKSVGVTWTSPRRPMEIPYDKYLRGFPFTGQSAVSAVTDSAIAVGEVTIGHNEVADIRRPPTDEKLVGLKKLVIRSWLDQSEKIDVYSRLVRIQKLTEQQKNDAACAGIKDLVRAVQAEAFLVALEAGPFASYDLALYDDFVTGVEELGRELGCPPSLGASLKGLELAPKDSQSPYAGTPLAWNSPVY